MKEQKFVQCCAVCAWRGDCLKKFSVFDGGARCLEFTRDISLKPEETDIYKQKY
jgi:hypothetical protein